MKALIWLSRIFSHSQRLISWLFYDWPGQLVALIIGILFIVLPQLPYLADHKALSNLLQAIGCSVVASALVVRVLSLINLDADGIHQCGVCFVGDRELFETSVGWDKWIRQTSRCGEIIVVGKKNKKWVEDSYNALSDAAERGISIRFIFAGSNDEISNNVAEFVTLIRAHIPNHMLFWSKVHLLSYQTSDDEPDFGFYWNGKKLIVKLYLQKIVNIEAPLIAFDTSSSSQRFDIDDFTKYATAFPFSQTRVLSRVALSLHHIISNSRKIPDE